MPIPHGSAASEASKVKEIAMNNDTAELRGAMKDLAQRFHKLGVYL